MPSKSPLGPRIFFSIGMEQISYMPPGPPSILMKRPLATFLPIMPLAHSSIFAGLYWGDAGVSVTAGPAAAFAFTVSSSFSNPGASSQPQVAARQYFKQESMSMPPFAKTLIFTEWSGKSFFCTLWENALRRASLLLVSCFLVRAFWAHLAEHGTAFTAHLPFFLSTSCKALDLACACAARQGHLSSIKHLPYASVRSCVWLFLPFAPFSICRKSIAMISRSYLRAQSSKQVTSHW